MTDKVAWRPDEWGWAIGLSRASVYCLLSEGKIRSVKNASGKHGARLIITSPAEYLDRLAEADGGELDRLPGGGR
jgi:hypothetical protein